MNPTHLDLFTGIGGFTIAAQNAGFETIGFSEIEPYACKILKQHWPNITNYGDIRTIPTVRCDLITGGFPCQPHSLAGKRRGSKDDRHLWPAMRDVIGRCKPTWVCGENVPGIIGVELDKVLSDLESLGYRVQPLVIPACAVDANHRRDRVWIVANAHSGRLREQGICSEQSERAEVISTSEAVADPYDNSSTRLGQHCGEVLSEQESIRFSSSGSSVADAESSRWRKRNQDTGRSGEGTGTQEHRPRPANYGRWQTEPAVGRVAHGIPNRAHRLKGLGNAIVPQVAEVILKAIRAALT